MKKLLRWIMHPIARWAGLVVLKRATANAPLLYPVLVDVSLNKDKYYRQYMQGKSYSQMIEDYAKGSLNSIKRALYKRERREKLAHSDPEFYQNLQIRWIHFCHYYSEKAEAIREEQEYLEAERAFNAL